MWSLNIQEHITYLRQKISGFDQKIYIITGPTSSGKSGLALFLSADNYVIINADSIQIYQELPILSAQPSKSDQEIVPHLLYSFLSGKDPYSLKLWLDQVVSIIHDSLYNNITPVIVGGTALYLFSLLEGISAMPHISLEVVQKSEFIYQEHGLSFIYQELLKQDSKIQEKIHFNDKLRILRAFQLLLETGESIVDLHNNKKRFFDKDQLFVVMMLPQNRQELYDVSEKRVDEMIQSGAIEEVRSIVDIEYPKTSSLVKTIGFQEIKSYLQGHQSKEQAISLMKQHTRNYIKKQYSWFRNKINYDYLID